MFFELQSIEQFVFSLVFRYFWSNSMDIICRHVRWNSSVSVRRVRTSEWLSFSGTFFEITFRVYRI